MAVALRLPGVTEIAQILKAVNPRFVPIAPAKVQRVASDDRQIVYLDFIGNRFRFERTLSRPFGDALRARTSSSERRCFVVARLAIRPGDPQQRITFLRNL